MNYKGLLLFRTLPLEEEAKYIVYGTNLMELFTSCIKSTPKTCGEPVYFNRTMINIKQECMNYCYIRECTVT